MPALDSHMVDSARPTRSSSPRDFGSADSTLAVLALDHRDSMSAAYARLGVQSVGESRMLEAKAVILAALADLVTVVMLDPLALSTLRPVGLDVIVPLEAQGYDAVGGGRVSQLMPDFGPAAAAAAGARGCKLFVYFRADHPATTERQLELVASTAHTCHSHGLPLVVEPTVYRLEGERAEDYRERLGELIVAGARLMSTTGADLLKLCYPGSGELCARISEVTAPTPWVLAGGETDGETFVQALSHACTAGACGFIAGRPIWAPALALDSSAQPYWLAVSARPLLERLLAIAHTQATRSVSP